MGYPRKVAEAYMNEPRGLIGAAYIDTYWLVVKIVLIAVAIGITVANMVELSNVEDGVTLYLNIASQIWQSALSSFGLITIIFISIQHYSPKEIMEKEENWSLSILEKNIESYEKVKVSDLVVEVFFACLAVVALNNGLLVFHSDQSIIPVLFMPIFQPYLIWINFLLVATIVLDGYLLIARKWQSATRILSIILDVAGVILFTLLVFEPKLWDSVFFIEILEGKASKIATILEISLNISLAVVVIIVAFDIVGHVKGLLKERHK